MSGLPEIRSAAPTFVLVRLDGGRITPAKLRGRAVLMVFLRHLF
ncbi:MAG: hypothetical protein ACE5G2_02530 [Candidatus Krumholzibacteriia bacterium]